MICATRLLIAICLFLASACIHTQETAIGMVRVTPERIVLETTEGEKLSLHGHENELKNLPDAALRLSGRIHGRPGHRKLEVEGYQIMDTGLGSIPHVGVLRWDTSRMVLEEQNSSAVVALAGPLEPELRRLVGAKVWIVGPVLGPESIEVLAFGVILPAGARP